MTPNRLGYEPGHAPDHVERRCGRIPETEDVRTTARSRAEVQSQLFRASKRVDPRWGASFLSIGHQYESHQSIRRDRVIHTEPRD